MRPRISIRGSVYPSVHPLIGDAFVKKKRKIIIFEQIIVIGGILDESHVITSSWGRIVGLTGLVAKDIVPFRSTAEKDQQANDTSTGILSTFSTFSHVRFAPPWWFLDASSHLYMRLYPSVGSICWSVTCFFSNAKNERFSSWKSNSDIPEFAWCAGCP